MNHLKFNQIVEAQAKYSLDLLTKKGKEYDDNTFDRLHSFKTAAALVGGNQTAALAGMMAKHTVSVYEMCNQPALYSRERWQEKITDSINYLLILRAMVEEELPNEEY